jgi:hypothetical protein
MQCTRPDLLLLSEEDSTTAESDKIWRIDVRDFSEMDFLSLIFLLLLAALVWYWFDSLRALEHAREVGRQACSDAEVQFLDDTVARTELKLVRDETGRRVLQRTYRFEFSETGNSRIEGRVILLGHKLESVTMDPYLLLP